MVEGKFIDVAMPWRYATKKFFFNGFVISTLPETNVAPENGGFQ